MSKSEEGIQKPQKANSYQLNKLKEWLMDSKDGYKEPFDKVRFVLLLDYILKRYPEENGYNKILDIGCGNGIFVKELHKSGYDALGIDNLEDLNNYIAGDEVKILSSDGASLPFEDNSFDMILCFEVLEHIPDYNKVLKEIRRCLKENGIVLITVPNLFCYDSIEGSLKIISNTIKLINRIRTVFGLEQIYVGGYSSHLHKYFPSKWNKEISKNGFRIIKQYPVFISLYIPEKIKILKNLEYWIYNYNSMIKFQIFLSRLFSGIFLLKYSGQTHLFVMNKKAGE